MADSVGWNAENELSRDGVCREADGERWADSRDIWKVGLSGDGKGEDKGQIQVNV